jgi:hypothetical protein
MLATAISFSYVAGTDITLEFTVTDQDDVAANIAGATPHFAAARAGEAVALSTEDVTAIATITSAATGVFQVSIDAADTEDLLGTYRFQAQIEDASGDISTVARGFLTFTESLLAVA